LAAGGAVMDTQETAERSGAQPDKQPGLTVAPGIAFEVGSDEVTGALEVAAEVTGARVHVEVQMPDRRVQVIFGSLCGSFLMLWLSDPDEIAELTRRLGGGP
jgi:hypothetical protein